MIKAVIFDVGGVLLTFEANRVYKDFIEFFGMEEKEFLDIYYPATREFTKGKMTESQFWKYFQKKAGTKKKLPKSSMYKMNAGSHWNYNHELIRFAKNLKDRHLKIAILSNVVQPIVDFMKGEDLYQHFDEVVLSCEVGMKKPDKEIYLHTLKLLGIKPQEAIFIDDLDYNIKAANELGMKGILFTDNKKTLAQLENFIKE